MLASRKVNSDGQAEVLPLAGADRTRRAAWAVAIISVEVEVDRSTTSVRISCEADRSNAWKSHVSLMFGTRNEENHP
jgi:hypothetical protein